MKEYGYIYKTTNLINNRVYIGQHKGRFDADYLGSGKYLKHSIIKNGKQNFKVIPLVYAFSQEELNRLEIYYISFYRINLGKDNLYNISDGGEFGYNNKVHKIDCKCPWCKAKRGDNPFSGKKHTPETRLKMRLKHHDVSGKNNPMFGKNRILSITHKDNISKGLLRYYAKV